MTRRGFLRRIGVGVVALTLARHLPGIAPVPVVAPPPQEMQDLGMSVRFMRAFDIERGQFPVRFDIAWAMATLRPDLQCVVTAIS